MPITALGFLLVFSIGCLVALKRPFIGLLLYFFVYYMHPPGKYWGSFLPEMRWTLIVAVITLLSTLIHTQNKSQWLKHPASKYCIWFSVYLLIQLPFALSSDLQIYYLILQFKLLMLFFLIVVNVSDIKRLAIVILANILGSAYIGLEALQTHTGGRFEAAGLPGINDGNLLGIHVVAIVFMGGFLFLSNFYNKKSYLLAIPLALAGNLIIMSGSRGAFVAIILTGFLMLVFSPKEQKAKLVRWGVIAIILLSLSSIGMILERFEAMKKDETGQVQEKSAASRIVFLEAQLKMFLESPLMGEGHRTTLLLSTYYIPSEYLTNANGIALRGSHNLTMSMLVDHGIIGTMLYILMVFKSIGGAHSVARNNLNDDHIRYLALGLIAGYLGVLMASQFSNSKVLEISIWMFALMTSLTFYPENKLKNAKKNEKTE